MEYNYSKNNLARIYGAFLLGGAGYLTNLVATFGESKDLLWSLPLAIPLAIEGAGDLVTGIHHFCSQKIHEKTSQLIKKIGNNHNGRKKNC